MSEQKKSGCSRRNFVASLSTAGAATAMGVVPLVLNACAEQARASSEPKEGTATPPTPFVDSTELKMTPVTTPGVEKLSFEWDGDVKVFRLIAEPVTLHWPDMSDPHGMARRPIFAWGYNGSVPGKTIEVTEGDRVRIHVTNNLSDPTTMHWHGLHIPIEMDGVPGVSQDPIQPGDTFTYEFTLEQSGTFFYHSHVMQAKQVGLGLMGFFIVHPKNPEPWMIVDHDFLYFLQIWMIHPGSSIPDTLEMNNFNYFTMNGVPGPDIVPMKVRLGDRVRIRVANLSMMAHPVHLHGHTYKITDWGGGFLPEHQHIKANTINISSAEVRVMDWQAQRIGKWMFHCHFSHHTMNDMHRTPLPNAGGHAGHAAHDMGGRHTYCEVVP